jgi:hypothetical protein
MSFRKFFFAADSENLTDCIGSTGRIDFDDSLRNRDVSVGLSGPNPDPVVLRGAPGSMASRNQNFAFASCSLRNKRFKFHVDVEYQGTSGAPHEIDVSMCDEAHAEAVRNTNGRPRADGNKLLMAFECKFYENTPGVGLGRTFVGLISDCGALRLRPSLQISLRKNLSCISQNAHGPSPSSD